MRKVTISVQVDAEKLKAIQFYAERKDSSVEEDLKGCIEKLYEKYVPGPTREYIESMTAPARPPRSSRPVSQTDEERDSHEQ